MAATDAIAIRNCGTLDEFRQCVALQRSVWGWEDEDLIPARFFVVAHKIEGQVIGAFEPAGRMIGFCLAVPALHGAALDESKPRESSLEGSNIDGAMPRRAMPGGRGIYLHSHMLAVLPEFRRAGIGRRLKLEQRRQALEKGIRLIEWTFDPLEWKNAVFNLNRLGAIARRYVPNQYGVSSSPLHRGLPTDRLVAEWWLDSPRVVSCLEGNVDSSTKAGQRITLPLDLLEHPAERASSIAELQASLRSQFQQAFAKGLAATGFETTGATGHYLLGSFPA